MAIKKSQVALHVRVKLNEKWKPKSLGDEYLQEDKVIFIKEAHVYTDTEGTYVFIGSMFNTGYAYLDQLDLEFPISDIGQATPTKLDLKIEELEKEITSIHQELSLSSKLKLAEGERIFITEKTADGMLPYKEELIKTTELVEKTKLLNILKELV